MSEQIVTKRCSKCKQIKPLSKFNKDRLNKKNGHQSQCKICIKEYMKEYRQTEEYKIAEKHYQKRYRESEKGRTAQKRSRQTEPFKTAQKHYRQTAPGHLRIIWFGMLYRCNNPKCKKYKYYGGRGIKVKFTSFDDFHDHVVNDLKTDSRGLTIDRIDNDGDYEKGNIRFVSKAENSRNRRKKYNVK